MVIAGTGGDVLLQRYMGAWLAPTAGRRRAGADARSPEAPDAVSVDPSRASGSFDKSNEGPNDRQACVALREAWEALVCAPPARLASSDGERDEGDEDDDDFSPLELFKGKIVSLLVGDGWTPCHAAAAEIVGPDGARLVMVPGASGSGKSTLAVALALRGYAVTDELVFVREAGDGPGAGPAVEAVAPPLPLSVSEETLRRLPDAAGWRLGEADPAGGKVPLRPPSVPSGVRTVAAVVLLRRGAMSTSKGTVSMRRAARHEVARALLENTARFSNGGTAYVTQRRRAWGTLCALLDRVPAYVLCGDVLSEGDRLVRKIESVLEGGRHVR